MEINYTDKNQLIITDKPIFYWILAIVCAFAFFIVFIVGLILASTKATLIGLFMFLVTLPALFSITNVNFNFNSKTKIISWSKNKLAKKQNGTIKFSKIKEVMLKESSGGGRSGSRSYAYLIYLILDDDISVEISNRLISLSKAKEIAEYIRKAICLSSEVKTIKALSRINKT